MEIPFQKIINYIQTTCKIYNIDESHGTKHALDIYKYCRNLVNCEVIIFPYINQQISVIYTAALLHNTCNKKYIDTNEGISNVINFLHSTKKYSEEECENITNIIQNLSYSVYKFEGSPILGVYQQAYNIVKEADLLTTYDFDKSIVYNMNKYTIDYITAFRVSKKRFTIRIVKYISDGFITSEYGVLEATKLLRENCKNIVQIEQMLLYDDKHP